MPYHRVPRAHIHEDLRSIEREGETVVSVTLDADAFHVFTEWTRPKGVEYRDTHAGRVGIPNGGAA